MTVHHIKSAVNYGTIIHVSTFIKHFVHHHIACVGFTTCAAKDTLSHSSEEELIGISRKTMKKKDVQMCNRSGFINVMCG